MRLAYGESEAGRVRRPALSLKIHDLFFYLQQQANTLYSGHHEEYRVMRTGHRQPSAIDKHRERVQIRRQVEEFLKRGGQIRVIGNEAASRSGATRVPAWHGHEDPHSLVG